MGIPCVVDSVTINSVMRHGVVIIDNREREKRKEGTFLVGATTGIQKFI